MALEIKNISNFSNCYGCGVCAKVCPKHIINIRLNQQGFYEPTIENLDDCINCGLCLQVCSYADDKISVNNKLLKTYAAWSNDAEVRYNCSSGGVGFELGRFLLKKGYQACGVRYNCEKQRAEHFIASTEEEFRQSVGSKYIQSYTCDAFYSINFKDKYLVIGTPCQIDSIRRYIKRFKVQDNFVLVDFFCHGVPSKFVWDKYISEVEKITGKSISVSFRNKSTGWHDSWEMSVNNNSSELNSKVSWHDSYNINVREKKRTYSSKWSQGDAFFNLFLSDACLGKACYDKCKYKYDQSAADIRIGDLWGHKYRSNEEGVTGVLVFTQKGNDVLNNSNCTLIQETLDVVAEGQIKQPVKKNVLYDKLMPLVEDNNTTIYDLHKIVVHNNKVLRFKDRLRHPLRTIINVIKKIIKKK